MSFIRTKAWFTILCAIAEMTNDHQSFCSELLRHPKEQGKPGSLAYIFALASSYGLMRSEQCLVNTSIRAADEHHAVIMQGQQESKQAKLGMPPRPQRPLRAT